MEITFWDSLKAELSRLGMTQEKLAKVIGHPLITVTGWGKGKMPCADKLA